MGYPSSCVHTHLILGSCRLYANEIYTQCVSVCDIHRRKATHVHARTLFFVVESSGRSLLETQTRSVHATSVVRQHNYATLGMYACRLCICMRSVPRALPGYLAKRHERLFVKVFDGI